MVYGKTAYNGTVYAAPSATHTGAKPLRRWRLFPFEGTDKGNGAVWGQASSLSIVCYLLSLSVRGGASML